MSNNYRKPIPSIFKKIDGTLGAEKWNPANINYVARIMYEKKYKNFVWGTQKQNFPKKLSLKSRLVIPKEDI